MATGMGMQAGVPSWAQQYNNPGTAGMYQQFFSAGDFSRTGFLDQNGLQAALIAAGENEIDQETVPLMIQMFDVDGNGRIDFSEFNTLMNYVNSMKTSYIQNAASTGGAGITTRDISSMMNGTHGQFMNEIGGEDALMTRGILPTINPTTPGFFGLGNVIKIAIIIGLMHTLYQHNKLPFVTNHGAGSHNPAVGGQYAPAAGFAGQQQAYNTGYGQPTMMTPGMGQPGMPPKQHGGILGRIFSSFPGRH